MPEHGTLSHYQNGPCRCTPCTDAMTAYHRDWRASRPRPARATKVIRDSLTLSFYEAANGDPLLAVAIAADWVRDGRIIADHRGLRVAAA